MSPVAECKNSIAKEIGGLIRLYIEIKTDKDRKINPALSQIPLGQVMKSFTLPVSNSFPVQPRNSDGNFNSV